MASVSARGPVQAYLDSLDAARRKAFERLVAAVRSVAPEATEGISYGMPALRLDGKGLAGFAAFKDHLSFFPMSGTVLGSFAGPLKGFKTSKGTVQFTLDHPLPLALVKMIVRARVAEIRGKTRPR